MINQPLRRFTGRTVLITGAAGAIGQAAAKRFADEGAQVALVDRDAVRVAQVVDQLVEQGYVALPFGADVADESPLAAAITQAEAHFGRIDVVFNNAGIGGYDISVADMPSEQWDQIIAVNLRGVFLSCKYSVPALARAGGGTIVNMGSSTGRHDALPGSAAYMASKAAVEALTKSLALQVARYRIRVNTICPGIIQTPLSFFQGRDSHLYTSVGGDKTGTPLSMEQKAGAEAEQFFARFAARIPLGRVGQPEDVAAAVAFLASDQARQITDTALLIDGGQTLRRWISAPDRGQTF